MFSHKNRIRVTKLAPDASLKMAIIAFMVYIKILINIIQAIVNRITLCCEITLKLFTNAEHVSI